MSRIVQKLVLILVFTIALLGFAAVTYAVDVESKYYTTSNPFYTSGSTIDEYGYPKYGLPNCTCFAWGRAYEAFGTRPNLSTHNGCEFWDYNIEHGYYPYGQEPKPGSIACWYGTGKYDKITNPEGDNGHVAFVESVSGDNVTISESGWGWRKPGSYYYGLLWHQKTESRSSISSRRNFQGYIYLVDLSDDHTAPAITSGRITQYSKESFSVTCEASDNLYIRAIQLGIWNDVIGIENAKWLTYNVSGKDTGQTFDINLTDFGNQTNTTYHVNAYAFDFAGNVSESYRAGDVYIHDVAPMNLGDQFNAYIRHQEKQVYLTQESSSIYGRSFTGSADQVWTFYRQSNGSYAIKNAGNNGYIDVYGASTEGSATVYTYTGGDYLDIPNQQFYIYYMYGAYYFSPVHSYGNNFLDMTYETNKIAQWGRAADWAPQEFDIFIIPSINGLYPANPGADFYAYIRHMSTGYYLTNQLYNIAGEPYSANAKQLWHFRHMPNGSYVITNDYDGSCIDVADASTTDGGNVYACFTGYLDIPNQRFYIYRMFNGYYFSPEHTNGKNMLDMSTTTYNLEMWSTTNQEWAPQQFMIDIVQYFVTLDCNGVSQTFKLGKANNENLTVNVSSMIPERNGYQITGWNTKADGTGTHYDTEFTYTINANITLYAEWQNNTVHVHSLTAHPQVDATCTTAGTKAYWSCRTCGKLFSDENAATQINAPVTITALGHVWGTPTYTWNNDDTQVTAVRKCTRNTSHKQTETANVVITTVAPTQTEQGAIIYSATFSNKAFSKQQKATGILPLKDLNVLKLPTSLEILENYIFTGTQAQVVIMPESVGVIWDDPFDGSNVSIILGYANSLAETFAEEFGYTFCVIDDEWMSNWK